MPSVYTYKLGINGSVTAGGTRLTHITGPSINVSSDAEELDIVAAGMVKAYVAGKKDVTISYTMKAVQVDGAYAPDIAAVATAFAAGTPIAIVASDSILGTISGDTIVTKMDETRENGKVISWSVEHKPTYTGTPFQIGS